MSNSRSDYQELYHKAAAYCAKQTAHLPDGASLAIAGDHPALAAWLRKADVAAQAGDYQACQGALREWMKGWRAAVQAHQLAAAA